ncbi:MAG: type II secretion system F family protein [Proteobacteria bacterium]|nr:type II secretion system F family protein [Pseudomonadota bacterium]
MELSLPIIAMGLGAIGIILFMLFDQGTQNKTLGRRLKRVKGEEAEEAEIEKISLKRETKDSGIPLIDRLIKSALPNPEKLRNRLARTGTKISVSEYLLMTTLCVAVFFMLFNIILGLKMLAAVFLALTIGLWIPHVTIGIMAKKRAKKFIKFFPESIDAMVRSIRSGLPIAEAVNVVANEMPDPIGTEFQSIRDGVRMGRSLEEAMWEVAKRLDIPEYRYLIIALTIQRETGGNLAETLNNVADVLRKRRQLKLKIKAMSSEAKASAMILGALPFIVIAVLSLVAGSYVSLLITDPRGNILCGIAVCMMGAGIYIMSQMINFEI